MNLLEPYLKKPISQSVEEKLIVYLELIRKWNSKTNLTSVRDPDEIVQRHFGESLFLEAILPAAKTILDFGSGAGLPGIPVQLMRPSVVVTLAESQGKKASFLREAVRTLDLISEVWAQRVEAMPADRVFDVVCMRAVDEMSLALPLASVRVAPRGTLALMLGREPLDLPKEFEWGEPQLIPGEAGLACLGVKVG